MTGNHSGAFYGSGKKRDAGSRFRMGTMREAWVAATGWGGGMVRRNIRIDAHAWPSRVEEPTVQNGGVPRMSNDIGCAVTEKR